MTDCSGAPLIHRMPYGFGPGPGPRQGPDGQPFNGSGKPYIKAFAVRFESEEKALAALLPPGFKLDGEPVVTIDVQYLTDVEWLAGRGYSSVGIKFPARRDDVRGSFFLVGFQNSADAITFGREELGYPMLYANIEEPVETDQGTDINISWDGTRFLTLRFLRDFAPGVPPSGGEAGNEGTLLYKYMPRTGRWGEADIAKATLTPPGLGNTEILSIETGTGQAVFTPGNWEQLPTLHHIVETLAGLPVKAWRTATTAEAKGGRDLRDQIELA
ncbi:MAG: acetoacetate decarboxylase family protein [Pseudomonadota bacterium]